MRKKLIIYMFLFGCCSGFLIPAFTFAKSYHVATIGNDAANTGSLANPYQTIQKAAEVMSPGDTCYIHAGIYYEMVRQANSGVEGKPLIFTVFRGGEVIAHGGEVEEGWLRYKGDIYKKAGKDTVKDLFVNRQYMLWARHQNITYDLVKGFDMLRPKLDTANPSENVDWTCVTVFKDDSRGNGWWNSVWEQDKYIEMPDYIVDGGWLMGVPGLIDLGGERCWKSGTLYFMSVGKKYPNQFQVEARVRNCGFDLSNLSYIYLKKITVFTAKINMDDSTYSLVEDCKVHCSGSVYHTVPGRPSALPLGLQRKGILISGSHNAMKNSEIVHSWSNGFSQMGENNKVYNCEFHDVGWAGSNYTLVIVNHGNHLIRRNTLHDSQRHGIDIKRTQEPSVIDSNEVYNAGLARMDCGLIYFDGQTNGEGTVVAYNWLHDHYNGNNNKLHGCGAVYLDDYSSNFIVHHKAIWNVKTGKSPKGIKLNNPKPGLSPNHHQIYNNTLWNYTISINSADKDWNLSICQPYWADTKVYNNIFLMPDTFGPAKTGNNFMEENVMSACTINHDFRLRVGSPYIDAGTVIPGVTEWFKGLPPNISAYEYGGNY